jgi:hypothetical protein
VSGTLHTQDDGHTTSRDEHINLTGRVPTSAGWDAIKDAFSKPAASIPSATPSQNKVPQKSHPDSPGEVLEDNATSGRRRADEDEDDDLTPLENDTSHTDSAEASDSNHKNREHAGKKPHPYSNLDDDIAANYWSEQIFPKRTIQYKFSDTKPRTQDAEYHSDDRPPAECKNNDWIDYYPYAYVQDSHSDNPNFSNPNAYVCEVDPIIKDPSQVRVEGAKQLGSGFFGIGESMILLYRRRLIGIPVFMGSVDNIYAGGSELITGKEKHTVFHKFMDAIGLDADAVDNAMDVFGTKPSIKSGFEGYNTRQRLRFFDNLNSSQNNSNPTDPQLDPNNEYYDFTFESESRGNVSRHGSGG